MKTAGSYCNLFLGHSLPSATLSRWTHVLFSLRMLVCGFVCRNYFIRAILDNIVVDETVDLAKLASKDAAGEGYERMLNQVRANRVAKWLMRSSTRWELVILFVVIEVVDRFLFFFLTGPDDSCQHIVIRCSGVVCLNLAQLLRNVFPARTVCNPNVYMLMFAGSVVKRCARGGSGAEGNSNALQKQRVELSNA